MIVFTRRVVITNAEMITSYRLKYQMINPLKIPASTTRLNHRPLSDYFGQSTKLCKANRQHFLPKCNKV